MKKKVPSTITKSASTKEIKPTKTAAPFSWPEHLKASQEHQVSLSLFNK